MNGRQWEAAAFALLAALMLAPIFAAPVMWAAP